MKTIRPPKVEKISERETGVVRITLTEADGNETVINVDEDVHFIFTFVVSKKRGAEIPAEILIKGSTNVCGELFYRIGITHPQIIQYCRKRAIEAALEDLRAKGIDLGAEAFRNARPVGGVQ